MQRFEVSHDGGSILLVVLISREVNITAHPRRSRTTLPRNIPHITLGKGNARDYGTQRCQSAKG
jgi:hypothetical protein